MDKELTERIAAVIGAGRVLCVHKERNAYVAYCPMRNAPNADNIECRHPDLTQAIDGALTIASKPITRFENATAIGNYE
jgi:hypothetical protein